MYTVVRRTILNLVSHFAENASGPSRVIERIFPGSGRIAACRCNLFSDESPNCWNVNRDVDCILLEFRRNEKFNNFCMFLYPDSYIWDKDLICFRDLCRTGWFYPLLSFS